MGGRIEGYIWSYKCARTYRDKTRIRKDGIVVDEDVLAKTEVVSIVDSNWRFNPRIVVE
jgi:hypothetical protein